MEKYKYDVFISYRRVGGAQYARILQLMLQQRGYRVFLDYDELTDGVFSDHIVAAIKDAPIFMLVLSAGALERCKNEDDWVRQEITLAMEEGKQIIPVNPDNTFDGIPEGIPDTIRNAAGSHQHSDISFGQTLGVTVDFMIKTRIAPIIGVRSQETHIDRDFDAAKQSLEKIDAHNRFMKRLGIIGVILLVLIALASAWLFFRHQRENDDAAKKELARQEMREGLEKKYQQFQLQLNMGVSEDQMAAVDDILGKMRPVNADSTLWMSQFECSRGQWCGILGDSCEADKRNYPMTEVNFGEVMMTFLDSLRKITGIMGFDLPSAEEWEYAAHGGEKHETTVYAGSDDLDEVAWYQGNSGGKAHPSDGQQGKLCNWLDLYDMSGNVCEWTLTPYVTPSGGLLWTVCGGHYNSPATEVTAASSAGIDTEAKEKTVGFRLIIRKE